MTEESVLAETLAPTDLVLQAIACSDAQAGAGRFYFDYRDAMVSDNCRLELQGRLIGGQFKVL